MLRSWRNPLIASGFAALAALIPRAITAGHFQNIDEVTWMRRSEDFGDALLALDFPAASATTEGTATMPGVTTMWLATLARGPWALGRELGLVNGPEFALSASALHLSQLAVAVTTSLLVGLLVLLAWRWAGGIVAVSAGALLATEPFLVGHGAVVHTDELMALFAATGTLALLLALGVPDRPVARPRLAAALAGVLLAGAFLSKVSTAVLFPGLALVVAWAVVRAGTRARASGGNALRAVRPPAGLIGITLAAGVATTLLAWPAIWADPVNQVGLLRESAELGRGGHLQFFRGEVTATPGPLFYLVATPFRMTPWFLVGIVAVIAAAILRSTRPRLAVLAVVALPALVAISLASKQFDRYVLVVVPFLALAVGLGLDALWSAVRVNRLARRTAAALAAVALAAVVVHAVWIAPWALAYFNPILGGAQTAERTILVGGGEGLEVAGERIRELEAPECDVTIAVLPHVIHSAFPCGSPTHIDYPDPDYAVIYVHGRQRFPGTTQELRASGRVVDVVTVRDIDYAEIIDLREAPPSERTTASPGGLRHAGGKGRRAALGFSEQATLINRHVARLKRARASVARVPVQISRIERDGWARFDRAYRALLDNDIRPIMALSGRVKGMGSQKWRSLNRELARRYGRRAALQVLNETNSPAQSSLGPRQYAGRLREAERAIRGVRPGATVIAAGASPTTNAVRYTRRVFDNIGPKRRIDAAANIFPRPEGWKRPAASAVRSLRQIRKASGQRATWVTTIGLRADWGWGAGEDRARHAAGMLRALSRHGARAVVFHRLVTQSAYLRYGALDAQGNPTPLYRALRRAARHR